MSIDIELKTLENFLGEGVKIYRDPENRIIVDGDIIISPDNKIFKHFPVQIYKVNGDLEWHSDYGKQNSLNSLINFPTIVNGNVRIYGNPNLTSLQYAPKTIRGNFEFDKCSVTSFEGISESTIEKNLIASYNPIEGVNGLQGVKVGGIVSLIDIDRNVVNEAKHCLDSSIIVKYISEDYRVII